MPLQELLINQIRYNDILGPTTLKSGLPQQAGKSGFFRDFSGSCQPRENSKSYNSPLTIAHASGRQK